MNPMHYHGRLVGIGQMYHHTLHLLALAGPASVAVALALAAVIIAAGCALVRVRSRA